ncbi:MAG: hypothetical protein RLZZ200_2820 [Pseudomonadota bacterium]|jgi:uncharacterized membrane protein (UPF0127 family)
MKYRRLEHNQRRLSWLVHHCTGAHERAVGLLIRGRPAPDTAWLLEPCSRIHTFGMRQAIDVLFCDEGWRVVDLLDALEPWCVAGHPAARVTWELPVGSIHRLGLRLGDRLCPV